VTGPQFNDLHKFLEGQYQEGDEIIALLEGKAD
jgi:DNA-binding ferritin-like protein